MANGQNKGSAKTIIYFGDDENFFDDLKPRFVEKYQQFQWEFLTIKEDSSRHIQVKYLSMIELKPVIIYFDFSSYSEKLKSLVEMISRDPSFRDCARIGFVENKENAKKFTGLGLHFIHVKGAELHDFVFDAVAQAMPNVAQSDQFATAKCEESITLYSFGKVGFMTASYIHLESNMPLEEGHNIYVHNGIDKNILPSSNFTVKKSYDHDLHYHYDYAYDLEYHYVDQPNLDDDELMHEDEDIDPMAQAKKLEEMREKRQEEIESFDHRLKLTRKKLKDWVWDKVDEKKEKKLKVLLYDPKMRILKEENCKPLDSFPFSLRCFSRLSDDYEEINKIRPGIIAVQLMGKIEIEDRELFLKAIASYKNKESAENNAPPKAEWQMSDEDRELLRLKKNLPEIESDDNELIKSIIEKIKSMDNYNPILVLLNCHLTSANAIQQSYQYAMVMSNEASVSSMVIESMSTMFMKKQQEKYEVLMTEKLNQLKQKDPKKYQKFSVSDLKEKRCYLNKNDELSITRMGNPGVLIRLNESEVKFTCDSILRMGIYYIEEPFPMFITLAPIEKGKPYLKERGTNIYRGLINGISEEDKKELRRYVNEVFFKPLEEKKAKEQQEFQKLTEQKFQEKIEEEKRLEEERLASLNTSESEPEEGDEVIVDPAVEGEEIENKSENDDELDEAG
jgi:hypothetical protein